MKKLLSFASILSLFLIRPMLTKAVCEINDQIAPCENFPHWPFVVFLGAIAFLFIFLMISLIFWLWMLIDVLRNEKENDLVAWFLVIFLFHLVGALIYYFIRKKSRQNKTKTRRKIKITKK